MRVLLDENLDRRLKRHFPTRFQVMTVGQCGWSGKQNGRLLRAAAADFDALLTMDKGLEFQQNLDQLDLAIVIVFARSNRLADVEPLVPEISSVLDAAVPGEVFRVRAAE